MDLVSPGKFRVFIQPLAAHALVPDYAPAEAGAVLRT